jgi:tRNA (cytidine56-2'-O)-methyltransferase
MTTHVGLTARALGADRLLLAGAAADRQESVAAVTDRFGGPFAVETTDEPRRVLDEWPGAVVHLTMYGLPVQDVETEIRERFEGECGGVGSNESDDREASGNGETAEGEADDGGVRPGSAGTPLLVVVGAEKVPFEVYEAADWNVAVTSQPHSEVASLAVFLDHLFEGRELDREWEDADRVVVPEAEGKRVEDA